MSNLKEAGTLLGQVVFGANNFLSEKRLSFLWKWRKICIFFDAIFLWIKWFRKFRKKNFFAHPIQHTRWSAFSWARKGCKDQRGPSLKNKPARIPRWKTFFSEKVTSECVVRDIINCEIGPPLQFLLLLALFWLFLQTAKILSKKRRKMWPSKLET